MKHSVIALSILSLLALPAAANANNNVVEDAIKNRNDLSSFYEALVNTGVINELHAGSYTILAPTNDAFAQITPQQYPCFYSIQCKAEVAQIVRNHIVTGEQHLDDLARQKGGLYAINKRFIPVGETNKDSYSVDGHHVISENGLAGSVLIKIDGVIANDRELASISQLKVIPVADQTTTTTTEHAVDRGCDPALPGCPQSVDHTTTVTSTTSTVAAPGVVPVVPVPVTH